jgi:hypothetical protein
MTTVESGVSSMVLVGDHSDRHPTLAAALAAFQAELPTLIKDEKAKVKGETRDGRSYDRSYGYADLAQVVETVLPVLGKHGLSVTSKNVFTAEGYMLKVTLLHESGESDTGDWPLPNPGAPKVGPQDIGSAMTYGRRYLTLALSGCYPGGEDDDGAKAQETARDNWENAKPAQRPVDDRQAQAGQEPQAAAAAPAPKVTWTDDEVLRLIKPMPTAPIGKAVQVYDWMASKDLHKRTVEMDYEGKPVKVTATDLIAGRIADEALLESAALTDIKNLQTMSANRGLMKVQVSDTETLAEALFTAQELAAHAAAQQAKADTPNAQDA